jgi:hypothetical protein
LWWDWEGPHPTPHTAALIGALAAAATSWRSDGGENGSGERGDGEGSGDASENA